MARLIRGPLAWRNKNEFLVLIGAIYTFVVYLTAFALEVLFLIDLGKQNNQTLIQAASQEPSAAGPGFGQSHPTGMGKSGSALDRARHLVDSMQTQATLPCLTMAVLYFLTFVVSLLLTVALILRSTFFLLTWICAMTTLYLPELGLVLYVASQVWGLETRNGQTELVFYLCRAVLNVVFLVRAHRLFRDWSYEKNFFRLKSSSLGRFSSGFETPPPFHISGTGRLTGTGVNGSSAHRTQTSADTLSTTINPLFDASSLSLNRFEHIRRDTTPLSHYANQRWPQPPPSTQASGGFYLLNDRSQPEPAHHFQPPTLANPQRRLFFETANGRPLSEAVLGHNRPDEDNYSLQTDNEGYHPMDLDYHTLRQHTPRDILGEGTSPNTGTLRAGTGAHRHRLQSSANLSYSTQSLDRRYQRDGLELACMPSGQVLLRPLGHEPFDYLNRPGSISHLDQLTGHGQQQPNGPDRHHHNGDRYIA